MKSTPKGLAEFSAFMAGLGRAKFHEEWHGLPAVFTFDKPSRVAFQFVYATEEALSFSSPRAVALSAHIAEVSEQEQRTVFRIHSADWLRRPEAVRNWLRHKAGRSQRLCAARNASLCVVPSKEARVFYDLHHLQGAAPGKHFGLVYEGEVVACLTFNPYNPGRGGCLSKGSYNLIRFALAGHVPGAASRLFKFACESLHATYVVTFSDRTYAQGKIYEVLGFEPCGEHPPDYRVYHPKLGLLHKAVWQRTYIPVRLRELGLDIGFDPDRSKDARTELDVCRIVGARHVWDLGKVKWEWRRQQQVPEGPSSRALERVA